MAGSAVEKLVQQHVRPRRNAELAPFDQPCRRRCRHDSRHAATRTAGVIALSTDDAPVGLDLDLQYFAVLGAGKYAQFQTALWTLQRVKLDPFAALRQVGLHRSTMSRGTRPLPPRCSRHARLSCPFAHAPAALASCGRTHTAGGRESSRGPPPTRPSTPPGAWRRAP